MPAIHVNAPGMIVNVNMAHQGEPEQPSQTDDDTATIRLRLGLLTTETLAEIGKQVCLVCFATYSSEKAAGILPCQHYFCASCIKGALEVLKADAMEALAANPTPTTPTKAKHNPGVVTIETIQFGSHDGKTSLVDEVASTSSNLGQTPVNPLPAINLVCPLCKVVHEAAMW